jgi:hypothetical protein
MEVGKEQEDKTWKRKRQRTICAKHNKGLSFFKKIFLMPKILWYRRVKIFQPCSKSSAS